MDPIQAAVLEVKLPHLNEWHRQRRENAATYTSLIAEKGLEQVTPPREVYGEAGLSFPHIYNQYVIRTPERDALKQYLAEQGVSTEIYYPVPFHQQECFRYLGYDTGAFPQSERAAGEVLALPIYPELSRDMQEYVIDKIGEFFSG